MFIIIIIIIKKRRCVKHVNMFAKFDNIFNEYTRCASDCDTPPRRRP